MNRCNSIGSDVKGIWTKIVSLSESVDISEFEEEDAAEVFEEKVAVTETAEKVVEAEAAEKVVEPEAEAKAEDAEEVRMGK